MGSGRLCCPRCLGRGSAWEEKACSALLSQAAARSHLRPGLLGPHHCTGLCLTLNSLSPFPKKPVSNQGEPDRPCKTTFNPAPCRHWGGRCPTADLSHQVEVAGRESSRAPCSRQQALLPLSPSHYHHPSCKGGVNACYPHPLLDHAIRDTGIPQRQLTQGTLLTTCLGPSGWSGAWYGQTAAANHASQTASPP